MLEAAMTQDLDDIHSILYVHLQEEKKNMPELEWYKDTIQYSINFKSKVLRTIRSCAKSKMPLSAADIEDIYSELLEYLHKSGDYSIERAMESSNSSTIPSLENYVNTCARNCVKRYISKKGRYDKMAVKSVTIDADGKEKDLIEYIPDTEATEKYDTVCSDIKSTLNAMKHKRYKYTHDIFMLLYVRLITMGTHDYIYRDILEVLGISKKELMELEKKMVRDSDIKDLMKAIVKCGESEAAMHLEKMVYNSKTLKQTIASIAYPERALEARMI